MKEMVSIELPLQLLLQLAVEKDFECPRLYQIQVERHLRAKGFGNAIDSQRKEYIDGLRRKITNSLGQEHVAMLDNVLTQAKEKAKELFADIEVQQSKEVN